MSTESTLANTQRLQQRGTHGQAATGTLSVYTLLACTNFRPTCCQHHSTRHCRSSLFIYTQLFTVHRSTYKVCRYLYISIYGDRVFTNTSHKMQQQQKFVSLVMSREPHWQYDSVLCTWIRDMTNYGWQPHPSMNDNYTFLSHRNDKKVTNNMT